MDELAGELAKASLEVFVGELSPVYQEMQAQLAGRLALNTIQLEDLRAQETIRRNNYALVAEFVGNLPGEKVPHRYRYGFDDAFPVEDAHQARQVQGHVIWVRESTGYSDKFGHLEPYYIVGKRLSDKDPHDDRNRMDLLLCKPMPSGEDDLQVITVLTGQYTLLNDAARLAAHQRYTPEEIKRMFDPETGMLRAERQPTPLKTQITDHILYKYSARKTKPERILKEGMQAKLRYVRTGKTLETTDLMSFNVLTHLNDLALAFGKVDELAELYDKYLGVSPESGTDKLLEHDDREADALMNAARLEDA